MNPQTGEILSLVSIPNFDNNLFAAGIKPDQYSELINDDRQPLFNRAVSGTYSNGSTMKPVVAAAGLQEGVISAGSTVTCHGEIDVPNQYNPSIVYSFPCWLKSGHGTLSVEGAIAQSCDVFFYTVSGGNGDIQGLGAERLARYMHLFGLGEKSGIDLPNENEGLAPTPGWKQAAKGETWYQGDTYHMGIGQGDVLTTPLQVLNYTACFANGGTFYQPQLARQIINSDGKIVRDFRPIIKRQNFIKPDNIEVVRQGMRQTVTSGTAKILSSISVPVAGKTGTAEVVAGGEMQAWFTCFAPYDNPQIALTVLLEKGGEGSDYAVPVAKRILDYYFKNK
jgi:penicillin-binding protein 2